MIVINLWGVPSSGKSTAAAYIFYKLKDAGVNCELVTEVAKDMVFDKNLVALKNQLYISGTQSYRLSRLAESNVDVVVTDAPLLLQSVYYRLNKLPEPDMMEIILNRLASEYKNYNYLLPIPDFEVSPIGRIHGNEECEEINDSIIQTLEKFCPNNYHHIRRSREDYDEIVYYVIKDLKEQDNAGIRS